MTAYVQGCYLADYDTATNTCTTVYLIPQTAGLPAMSLADAQEIGVALALLWAVAWVIRRVKRLIDQS
jgi:hypothetical protein